MAISVVPHQGSWRGQAARVIAQLEAALRDVEVESVEHVGSTSVPGLAAKPVLDIDVIVPRERVQAAIEALSASGYRHVGDRGIAGRESMEAPDDGLRRNVYVCQSGTLHVRNHLAVRDILRARPDLRDEYGAVKMALVTDSDMDIDTYVALKSAVLQKVLAESELNEAELLEVLQVNDSKAPLGPKSSRRLAQFGGSEPHAHTAPRRGSASG